MKDLVLEVLEKDQPVDKGSPSCEKIFHIRCAPSPVRRVGRFQGKWIHSDLRSLLLVPQQNLAVEGGETHKLEEPWIPIPYGVLPKRTIGQELDDQ